MLILFYERCFIVVFFLLLLLLNYILLLLFSILFGLLLHVVFLRKSLRLLESARFPLILTLVGRLADVH